MLTNLKSLATLLDQITEGATRAQEATQTLAATTAAAVATSVSSVSSLSSVLASVSVQTTQTAQTVQTALADMHTHAQAAHTDIATRLDDLQNAVANHANLWNKAVSELIDAVKIGAVPISQLITLYGDAQIGGQRLREYLDGLDFNFYQDKVHDLITGLQNGTVEIAQVQDYLGKTQLLFAKQLADIIELFRKGAVTLKRVEEIVRDIQKAFPQSEFSDLAQALYDALRKGA
jgi:DNA-binding ferritin-like protein (Dps family)